MLILQQQWQLHQHHTSTGLRHHSFIFLCKSAVKLVLVTAVDSLTQHSLYREKKKNNVTNAARSVNCSPALRVQKGQAGNVALVWFSGKHQWIQGRTTYSGVLLGFMLLRQHCWCFGRSRKVYRNNIPLSGKMKELSPLGINKVLFWFSLKNFLFQISPCGHSHFTPTINYFLEIRKWEKKRKDSNTYVTRYGN